MMRFNVNYNVRMQGDNRNGIQQGLVTNVIFDFRAQCLEFEDAGFSYV